MASTPARRWRAHRQSKLSTSGSSREFLATSSSPPFTPLPVSAPSGSSSMASSMPAPPVDAQTIHTPRGPLPHSSPPSPFSASLASFDSSPLLGEFGPASRSSWKQRFRIGSFQRARGSPWSSTPSFNFTFSFPAPMPTVISKEYTIKPHAVGLLRSPLLWLYILLTVFALWMLRGTAIGLVQLGQGGGLRFGVVQRVSSMVGADMRFVGANNANIHYVGRWTSTPNRMRWDGAFPGVYFDLNITGTSTLLLSLANLPRDNRQPEGPKLNQPSGNPSSTAAFAAATSRVGSADGRLHNHLSFTAESRVKISAGPVSLLARVDDEEYIAMPNVSHLVSVRVRDLDTRAWHSIRVIAPMVDGDASQLVQLEGIWIEKDGRLGVVEGTRRGGSGDGDVPEPEGAEVGIAHERGLSRLWHLHVGHDERAANAVNAEEAGADPYAGSQTGRKKLLEIITDVPGSHSAVGLRGSGGPRGLLAGVLGWEYLLGEMFSADHISVGVDGACLVKDCVTRKKGRGWKADDEGELEVREHGMGDVYFRSGPTESQHFQHTWPFSNAIPDVIILNLGSSDADSFLQYAAMYNESISGLRQNFEDAYVSLVKAIRSLAYPESISSLSALSNLNPNKPLIPSRLGTLAYDGELAVSLYEVRHADSDYLGYDPSDGDGINDQGDDEAPLGGALIPIFIMRPLAGELEHSTLAVVERLRCDGDAMTFWVDTTGWLDVPAPPPGAVPSPAHATPDYHFAAGNASAAPPNDIAAYLPSQFRLTPRANQKVALYLHMHVCRFLAARGDRCPFLRPDVYGGRVYDPGMEHLERWVQDELEKKVKGVLYEEERPRRQRLQPAGPGEFP